MIHKGHNEYAGIRFWDQDKDVSLLMFPFFRYALPHRRFFPK